MSSKEKKSPNSKHQSKPSPPKSKYKVFTPSKPITRADNKKQNTKKSLKLPNFEKSILEVIDKKQKEMLLPKPKSDESSDNDSETRDKQVLTALTTPVSPSKANSETFLTFTRRLKFYMDL